MMNKTEEFQFLGGKVKLLAPDVLMIQYTMNRSIVISDVMSLRDLREKLMDQNAYYPIVDFSNGIVTFSEEAKAWIAVNKESSQKRVIDIYLVKGFVMKWKVKLYNGLFKPNNPSLIVTSLDEALAYIENDRNQRLSSGK